MTTDPPEAPLTHLDRRPGPSARRAGLTVVLAVAILAVARHERDHPGQGFGLAAGALLAAAAVVVTRVLWGRGAR